MSLRACIEESILLATSAIKELEVILPQIEYHQCKIVGIKATGLALNVAAFGSLFLIPLPGGLIPFLGFAALTVMGTGGSISSEFKDASTTTDFLDRLQRIVSRNEANRMKTEKEWAKIKDGIANSNYFCCSKIMRNYPPDVLISSFSPKEARRNV